MAGRGHVVSVDRVTTKQGKPAWQVVTDYDPGPRPDGLRPCAIWIPRLGPKPMLGQWIEWGPHHAWWGADANGGGPATKVEKIDWEFDPNDPKLYTG